MNEIPPVPEAPPAAPPSLVSRLTNVFAAPGEVFESVKAAPHAAANWLAPALLFILAGWVGAWLIFSQDSIKQQLSDMASKAIDKQVEKGKIPKDQAESARQRAEKYGVVGAEISAVTWSVFGAFISPFWGGLMIWLVGTKVLKGGFPYMKAVEVAGLANMISVLEAIVRTLLVVWMGNLYASSSLVLLLKDFDPQNPLIGILAAVNVMTFWLLAVRSVGLARLSGASFAKAAAWMYGIWAVLMALMIGFGFAFRAIAGG
jgi:VIT1/CCC1 family predicted Fe2+/Mn2+ transporter